MMIIAIIISIIYFFSIYFSINLQEESINVPKAKIRLLDKNRDIINNDFLYEYIPYSHISQNVINAFIALEDKRFYTHHGIDYHRLLGALYQDIKTMSFKEGGSTITQQLAKNTLLSGEKTLNRKIREMRLAHLIERKYSKEQIIEMYLNAIYYGNGIYGIDCAAKNYFNKKASDLTPSEGAILAGIVKNPSRYSPNANTKAAIERRNLVLKLMYEQGYLTEKSYYDALSDTYAPISRDKSDHYYLPYYSNALSEASAILGISEKELILSDYVVSTFYDDALQKNIFSAILSDEYSEMNDSDETATGTVLVSNNDSGGITAFGSKKEINVFSLRRQPGSVIKPILDYAPAIEFGQISPQSLVLDEKVSINGYSPNNYSGTYKGWISAKKALSSSVNTVAVKLLSVIGVENGKRFAEKCGMSFDKNDGLAASLGGLTKGSTLIEIAESYMTLANGGLHKKCSFIKRIETSNGEVLYQHTNIPSYAMSKDTAFLVTNMLEDTIQNGTAIKMKGFPYAIAAKTGTTQSTKCNDNLDAWNVSFTTEKTAVVWYGDLKNTPETSLKTTGSGLPTLLARKIHTLLSKPQKEKFDVPDSVFEIDTDSYAEDIDHTLYLAHSSTPKTYRRKGYYSLKNCPTTTSPYFDLSKISFTIRKKESETEVDISGTMGEDYTFLLEERDLITGEKNVYEPFSAITAHFAAYKKEFFHAFTRYKLYVYYKGELLGDLHENIFNYDHNEVFPLLRSHHQ